MDASASIKALSASLDMLVSGGGIRLPSLQQQHVRFGSSSYGWVLGSLQTALEAGRVALATWGAPDQLPASDAGRSSTQRHGSRDSSSVAGALSCAM